MAASLIQLALFMRFEKLKKKAYCLDYLMELIACAGADTTSIYTHGIWIRSTMRIKIKPLLLLSFLFVSTIGFTQDLFSYESSLRYTDYLIQRGDYTSAELELNRMEKELGKSDTITLLQLRCYKLSGKKDAASLMIQSLTEDTIPHCESLLLEALQVTMYFNRFTFLPSLIQRMSLPIETRERLYFYSYLLLNDTTQARLHLNKIADADSTCLDLFHRLIKLPKLKTSTGLLLSVFPGAGAMYAKQKHAGLTNTSVVTIFSWLSYRGFSQKGIGSIYGWVYATGATVFYAGGIYSTPKSVRRYNQHIFSIYQDEVKHTFENTLIR